MSIQSEVKELKNIDVELRNLGKRAKILRDRRNIVKGKIAEFLRQNNTPGVKYQGDEIILEEEIKYGRKKKEEIQHDSLELLARYGVSNPEQVLKEMANVKKGSEEYIEKIKIRKKKDL